MKCPLRIIAIPNDLAKGIPAVYDCQKEDCAWWLEDIAMCAIRELALETRYAQFRLDNIASGIQKV